MCPHRSLDEGPRQPHEEWEDYVQRLEQARLASRALRKQKEVEALELAARRTNDPELHLAAKDAARDFKNMLRKLRQAANL